MSKVRLPIKSRIFDLDPNKSYLIEVDKDGLDGYSREVLSKELEKMGLHTAVAVLLPKDKLLKITELKKETL